MSNFIKLFNQQADAKADNKMTGIVLPSERSRTMIINLNMNRFNHKHCHVSYCNLFIRYTDYRDYDM